MGASGRQQSNANRRRILKERRQSKMTVSTECDLELHKALEARANTAEPNNSSVDRMDQGWHLPVAM